MSAALGLSGSKSKSSQDTTQQKQQTSFANPTFGNEAQSTLASLTGKADGTTPSNANAASDLLLSMGKIGGMNPYTEEAIAASNREAGVLQGQGLAKLRAQGYRGGTAANLFGQGMFTNDFAAKLAGENARTRMGAYDTGADRSLRALGGAAETGAADQALALQLLSLLRGEVASSTENAQIKSKGTGSQIGFSAVAGSTPQSAN